MVQEPPNEPTSPMMVTPRVIAVRKALGMSKAEFADMVGIDRSSYTKIEKGTKPLLPKDAYRIWQLYGIDLNFLYLGQVGGLPSSLSSKIVQHLNM